MFKKFVCLILSLLLITVPTVSAFASSKVEKAKTTNISVHSKEFPNAYIEQKSVPITSLASVSSSGGKTLIALSEVTVFVEEKIVVSNGKPTITSSKLLSKEEVDAIGKNNFTGVGQYIANGGIADHYSSRGKLTIRLNGWKYSDNRYQVNMDGTWSAPDYGILYGETNPSAGDDFMGFAWGGGYDIDVYDAYATDDLGNSRQPYLSNATPGAGIVWSVYEGSSTDQYDDYMKSCQCWSDIYKNTLTGGGNTTSIVAQYIHTYQAATGGISFSGSSYPSFSLSGTDKQWSLAAIISGILY